jgi:hypothetical protein
LLATHRAKSQASATNRVPTSSVCPNGEASGAAHVLQHECGEPTTCLKFPRHSLGERTSSRLAGGLRCSFPFAVLTLGALQHYLRNFCGGSLYEAAARFWRRSLGSMVIDRSGWCACSLSVGLQTSRPAWDRVRSRPSLGPSLCPTVANSTSRCFSATKTWTCRV